MLFRASLMLFASATLVLGAAPAIGQTYPDRPVRLLVGYPPGGQSDLVGRLVGRKLGELLGGSFVIENRAGAGGAIATEVASRAPADGYTLLLGGGGNLTLAPVIEPTLRYDVPRDFAPIGRVARVPLVVAVRADLPVASASELIEYARRHPGKLTYASGATTTQVALESMKAAAGLDIVHIPYKGTAPAVLDVVAGRVDIVLADVAVVAPHVQSKALKLIASAGATRPRAYSHLPTMTEQGVADFIWESWQGLLVPKGTPDAVIAALQSGLRQALAAQDFREDLQKMGFEPIDEDPTALAAFLPKETEQYRRHVSRAGVSFGK